MPDFVRTEINAIDEQLRVLKDEASRLEAALAALTGGARRRGRPARNGAGRTPARPRGRRDGRAGAPRPRGGNTRASQALELVREKPGITIPEIAKAMKIEPNYLYRVLPRLAAHGQVKRDGQGWHTASSSTSTRAESVRNVPGRKQTRAAQVQAGGLRNSGQARSAKPRIDTADQRSDRPGRDQGVRARRARGWSGDDRQPGRHQRRARAADSLDHAVQAGQDR